MANGWTPERRARQAELIRIWKPWQRATGPRTAEGKARVSQNSYRGGVRPKMRALALTLRCVQGGQASESTIASLMDALIASVDRRS